MKVRAECVSKKKGRSLFHLVNSSRVCKQTRHCCQSQERGTAMAAQCQQTSRQPIRSRILNCYNFYTELFMLVHFNLRSAPHLWALPRQVITQVNELVTIARSSRSRTRTLLQERCTLSEFWLICFLVSCPGMLKLTISVFALNTCV